MNATGTSVAGRAVIRHDHRLLLVTDDGDYWYSPGGRMEPTETLPECVAREVHEETGLRVTVGDILAVSEYLDPRNGEHKVECCFAAELVDQPNPSQVWQDTGGSVRSFGLFSDTDLAGMDVQPPFLRAIGLDRPDRPRPVYIDPNL